MRNKQILVVDDEKAILLLFKTAFKKAGYEVFTAGNGKTALSLIETNDLHVMFLDLNIPDMDGIELCRKIKKITPISVVYAVTGYGTLFELSDCLDAGFSDYFKKPVNVNVLLKAAREGLGKVDRWKSG